MIIHDDRAQLATALADTDTTVLVLSGGSGGAAGSIHDLLDSRSDLEPWRRWFLIPDLSVLNPSQRSAWFGGADDCYVVLGGGVPKKIGPKGPLGDLLRANGRPSILRVRGVFARGDQL